MRQPTPLGVISIALIWIAALLFCAVAWVALWQHAISPAIAFISARLTLLQLRGHTAP